MPCVGCVSAPFPPGSMRTLLAMPVGVKWCVRLWGWGAVVEGLWSRGSVRSLAVGGIGGGRAAADGGALGGGGFPGVA